jgi:WD40 repeat protein
MSRRLRISLALSSMAALFAALVWVKVRLSYRPVSVESFSGATTSGTQYVPLVWQKSSLWVLANPDGWFGLTAPFNWKTARNWNRTPVDLILASPQSGEMAAFCPAQNLFAQAVDGAKIKVWRASSVVQMQERGHRNQFNVMKPELIDLLSLSPDGKRLVASSHLGGDGDHEEDMRGFCELGLVLFDTQTGKQIARQSAFEGIFSDVAWSPDSRALAGITVDGFVFVLDAQTGKLQRHFRAHGMFGACVAWSPDGKTLVTATNPRVGMSPLKIEYAFKSEGRFMGIGAVIGQGKNKRVLATDKVGDATWNGKTERQLKRFDARTGKQIGAAIPLQTGAVDLAFSPDGSQLALGEHEFALILNAQTLATERRLDVPTATASSVPAPVCLAWSQDGATLATSTSRGVVLWRMR